MIGPGATMELFEPPLKVCEAARCSLVILLGALALRASRLASLIRDGPLTGRRALDLLRSFELFSASCDVLGRRKRGPDAREPVPCARERRVTFHASSLGGIEIPAHAFERLLRLEMRRARGNAHGFRLGDTPLQLVGSLSRG